MEKNIVLCSDGTGNKAIKDRGSNVFKLYEAVERHGSTQQLVFYDDGVGTDDIKLLKILGGAFGFGMSRNVRELYCNLARSYSPGDKIYLFGFSRGAYTARTLAGFISRCGVLDISTCTTDKDVMRKVKGAYKAYRHDYNTLVTRVWRYMFSWLTRYRFGFTRIDEFTQYTHENGNTPIQFIGVWDTVSAVGFPVMGVSNMIDKFIYKYKFPTTTLHKNVRQACHAVSIDDKRKTFHPELWDESNETGSRIQQVWFAGVHANVGGGYQKHGMSLVAMDWMMKKSQAMGLVFNQNDAAFFQQHADVNDKLYNSRSGIGAYYRYEPRNIYKICQKYGIQTPLIHESVLLRSQNLTDGYAPGNLPRGLKFVSSDQGGYVLTDKSDAIDKAMGSNTTLLDKVSPWIGMRKSLQLIFYVLTAAVIYLLYKENSISLVSRIFADMGDLSAWVELVKIMLYAGLLVPVILVGGMSIKARKKIQNTFSGFWYQMRGAT